MTTRDAIVANALWGVANEPQIHYSQGSSRFAAMNSPRHLPLYTDCSGFVTLCYSWAGASDPNGLGYSSGYTGTLLDHLPQISLADAQPGDLIVYGPGNGDHVVVIVEPGSDPMTVSHGQEVGPIRVRHSVEARAHRPPYRVLRGIDASSPPNPPDPPAEDDMTPEQDTRLKNIEQLLAGAPGDGGLSVRNLLNDPSIGMPALHHEIAAVYHDTQNLNGQGGEWLRVAAVQEALKQVFDVPKDGTVADLRNAIVAALK